MSVVVRIPSGEIKLLCKGAVSDRLTFIITKSIKLNIQMSFYKCQNYFMLKCQARILGFFILSKYQVHVHVYNEVCQIKVC